MKFQRPNISTWRVFSVPLLVPLTIKFGGMLLVFVLANRIVSLFGLDAYGRYAQIVSLIYFFAGLSALGMPQLFIRDVAGKSFYARKKIFAEMHAIIFTISLLMTPFLALFVYLVRDFDPLATLLVCVTYIVISGSRLRVSLIRTTRQVQVSEAPELLVRQAFAVGFILFVPSQSETILYVALCFAVILSFASQYALSHRCIDVASSFSIALSKKSFLRSIGTIGVLVWVYSSINLFKDFFEIFLIGMFFGDDLSGAYKVVLQFSMAFMAIFNSINLVRSASYAKFIENSDTKGLNHSTYKEMLAGLAWMVLFVGGFVLIGPRLGLLEKFGLHSSEYTALYILIAAPVWHLLVGPIFQVMLHSRKLYPLIAVATTRILAILFFCVWQYKFGSFSIVGFAAFVVCVEVLLTSLSAVFALKKMNYTPPFWSGIVALRKFRIS